MAKKRVPFSPLGRWHVGETGFEVEEVVLSSNGLWHCSCAQWRQQTAPMIADCRHILFARGVKTSRTARLFYTIKTAEGSAPVAQKPKPEVQPKPSGPIRKVELE